MKNIVILGAGFAGLRAALKLEKKLWKNQDDWHIILIDKNSYHTYTAALYEASSAYKGKRKREESKLKFEELVGNAVCLPIRSILGKKRIEFVQDEITGVDFDAVVVKTKQKGNIPFAYVLFALGSETIYFDIKGARQCCMDLKTLPDALRIRRRIEDEFAKAGSDGFIRIMMVGGGFSGVETIAEIALYARRLAEDYGVERSRVSISLLEAQSEILGQATNKQRKEAERRLQRIGVEIRTNAKISEVTTACVILEGGEKKCEGGIILWGGGVKGPGVARKFTGIELGDRDRIVINTFLQAKGFANVFAVGDNALFFDKKSAETAPPLAFVAEAQADVAAENIVAAIRGQTLKEYRVYVPGYVASCGGKYALAHIYGLSFTGFWGWILKRLIDLKYFLSILPPFLAFRVWVRELRLFTKND